MKPLFLLLSILLNIGCFDTGPAPTSTSTPSANSTTSTNNTGEVSPSADPQVRDQILKMMDEGREMAIRLKNSYTTDNEEQQYTAYEQKRKLDSTQAVSLYQLIKQHGWLNKSVYGNDISAYTTTILKNAPPEIQKKCLPLILAASQNNEVSASEAAIIHDKVLIHQGKKQLYGTQISFNKSKGMNDVHPIEDPENVETRRAKVGLSTLEDFLRMKGIKR